MEIVSKTFSENLNEWFRLLGRTWKPLLSASLMAFVPVSLLFAVTLILTGAADSIALLFDVESLEQIPDSEILARLVPLIWSSAIWIVAQSIATVFVHLAAARTVAEDRAGLAATWRTACGHAARRFAPALLAALVAFLGLTLAVGLAIGIGWVAIDMLGTDFLAIFVTSVVALTTFAVVAWLGLSVSLYPQVMAMEEVGPIRALVRSFTLVRQRWWMTLGFVLVTALIASAVSQVVGIAFVPLSITAVFAPQLLALVYVLAGLLQGPVAAAIASANAVWYLDLRSRDHPLTIDQIV